MAKRSRFGNTILMIDGDACDVRYRRFNGLEAATTSIDVSATYKDMSRLQKELDKLNEFEAPDEAQTMRMREIKKQMPPLFKELSEFVHEGVESVSNYDYERDDGSLVPYNDATADEQLWLIRDAWLQKDGGFNDLVEYILGFKGEPDPKKSSAPEPSEPPPDTPASGDSTTG